MKKLVRDHFSHDQLYLQAVYIFFFLVLGIEINVLMLPSKVSECDLVSLIHELNEATDVDGILLQVCYKIEVVIVISSLSIEKLHSL